MSQHGFKQRYTRLRCGLDTRKEFLLYCLDWLSIKLTGKFKSLYLHEYAKRLARTFTEGNIYRIGDVKLPVLNKEEEFLFFAYIYEDTFTSYVKYGDDYSEAVSGLCDKILNEGLYGLINDKVNVSVRPGDVVIDAGSWIGDFAAYASVKGASVYAFEPAESTFAILSKTAELNGNITPVMKGLSDENTSAMLYVNLDGNSGANSLKLNNTGSQEASSSVETVRLDDFVKENGLSRVDFIKADIEGFERKMLAGAQETLARFAPKLALCTYHLPDDPEVLSRLILQANPRYNIVQRRMKLYASVPE